MWNFLDDDVIIVMSSIHRTEPICVLFSSLIIYHTSQAINSIRTRKTNNLNKLMSSLQVLNISVSFINISSEFVQTFVPSDNKLLNA